ncbi:MAG TPA: inositol monophosphatase family protein [bacterium]|jgi:myo-inositol-1(or 4)-monophosphatase
MPTSDIFSRAKSLSPEVDIALEAARLGGDVLLSFWQQLQTKQIHEKGKGDLVTAADVASEEVITDFLKREMPEAAIVSEEGHGQDGNGPVWYVDPLDGTTNFVQQFPVFAVSIGMAQTADRTDAKLRCGVVYNPVTGDLFYGSKGKGSYHGDLPLKGSPKTDLGDLVVATGFPRRYVDELASYLKEFAAIFPEVRGIRRAGSAALDLCWTAQAIFDGFWEHRLSPWDVAAGALIVEEAGGICSDFEGKRGFLQSGDILGATPQVHAQLLRLIQKSRD